jgi:hypothetical protein
VFEHCYAAVAQHSAAGSPDQGDRNNHCPLSDTYSFTYNTSSLPEGATNLGIDTYDINGAKGGPATNGWVVKVDRSAPVVDQPTGSLWDARNTTLGAGTFTLNVHASDGATTSAATQRSGVEYIDVSLDGQSVDYVSQDCTAPEGSCQLSDSWSLDAADLSAGTHTVDVTATDGVGHTSQPVSFSFTTPCCLAAAQSWGTLASTSEVRYADVDGDGLDDMVVRDKLTGAVSVGLSDGTQFGSLQPWGSWNLAIASMSPT